MVWRLQRAAVVTFATGRWIDVSAGLYYSARTTNNGAVGFRHAFAAFSTLIESLWGRGEDLKLG
jgi:hypothetical protein